MTELDASATGRFASWGMYSLPSLQAAWGEMYDAAATLAGLASAPLRWDVDPHDTWLDPHLAIGMACGWPLVIALRDRVRVVGTFAYRGSPDGDGSHLYRSQIVSRSDMTFDALSTGRAAINSPDSLSGSISLLDAFGVGSAWPGEVVSTGAHLLSIDAVRIGSADVASIDAMTWAYATRDDPGRVDGLTVVGRGPLVPCLPVVLPAAAGDAELTAWRAALHDVTHDPASAMMLDQLLIGGFVPLDLDDYDALLAGLLDQHRPRPL
jgi:ABC-type phosphate/phosphonate transport system substrate-binding protein